MPMLVVLVMLMVSVLPAVLRVFAPLVMPMARALQVMHWWMVLLVMLVRCCRRWIWVRVWVVVGGSGRGPSPLLAEGPVGVAGRCIGPGGVGRLWCWGSSSPLLAEGPTAVVDGEGGDVMVLLMRIVLQVLYGVMPQVRALWVVLLRLGCGIASDAVVLRVLSLVLRVLPLLRSHYCWCSC